MINRLTGLLLIFLFLSCKKGSSPSPISSSGKPIRSMVVTYPASNLPGDPSYHKYNYRFSSDTVHNRFNIHILDSVTLISSGSINEGITDKTYYLSGTVPERVIKISFRHTEHWQYAAPTPYYNYDILFTYSDNTTTPAGITVTNYSDLAATQVDSRISNPVYRNDNILEQNYLDIVNCTYHDTLLQIKWVTWIGKNDSRFIQTPRTGNTFDVEESDPFYRPTLFSFPPFTITPTSFKYLYAYDNSPLCKSFVIDMLTYKQYSFGPTSPYGQRKIDFDYTSMDPALDKLFSLKYNPSALFWEKVAQQSTDITRYSDIGPWEYVDGYIPDLYAYYQDIATSYTDSVFTVDTAGNRTLYASEKFTNQVVKDAQNNVLTVTKYDSHHNIIRLMEIGYDQ